MDLDLDINSDCALGMKIKAVTTKTKKVPKHIWANIKSARSALIDADSLPGALEHNASRYFLLLTAWELYQTADVEFHNWASKIARNKKLLSDHGYKLRKAPEVKFVKIENGKAVVTPHKSEDQKKKLRELLLYGGNSQTREALFMRGWHFDTFRNRLIGRISFLEVVLQSVDELTADRTK